MVEERKWERRASSYPKTLLYEILLIKGTSSRTNKLCWDNNGTPFCSWWCAEFTQHLTPPWPPSLDKQKQTSHQKENWYSTRRKERALQVSVCVQVCVCLMWHIWARLCESEWACTGVNLYDIPQPSPSATTYPADCGHTRVYFSLPPAGHECAYLIELKACRQSRPPPHFFFFFLMWESKLLLLWVKWWVQLFGTRERASREGK